VALFTRRLSEWKDSRVSLIALRASWRSYPTLSPSIPSVSCCNWCGVTRTDVDSTPAINCIWHVKRRCYTIRCRKRFALWTFRGRYIVKTLSHNVTAKSVHQVSCFWNLQYILVFSVFSVWKVNFNFTNTPTRHLVSGWNSMWCISDSPEQSKNDKSGAENALRKLLLVHSRYVGSK